MERLIKGNIGIVFMLFSFPGFSQAVITLQLSKKDTITAPGDSLYVAGSFNQWSPNHPRYQLQQGKNGNWIIKLTAAKNDILEFKFTRGSWEKVETLEDGSEAPNHLLKVTGDTAVSYTIENWKDLAPTQPKQHTTSPQVQVLDTAFFLKALGAQRRVWLYLPKDYTTTNKRYPVLYLHDGQNVFDASTAAYGEWGVDEILDSLYEQTGRSCIVVAVDHGGTSRITDYNPYSSVRSGTGRGRQYVKSLVESVKPFIDDRYRTLPDAQNTWVAGSSMGGLISMWAVMQYPKVFGGAGILSPAFWTAPQIHNDAYKMLKNYKGRLFFYAGGLESRNMVNDMDAVISRVRLSSKASVIRYVESGAGHNEAAWNAIFPTFLKEMLLPD